MVQKRCKLYWNSLGKLYRLTSLHISNQLAAPTKPEHPSGSKQVSENATFSLNDRRANQKAVLACFVAENSLPFSLAPKLVEFCQTLAKDSPALSKLKMEWTAATYITGYGVAKTMREELVAKLNKNYFSMNVDEATNNNGDKIINVLVRVYDDEKEKKS
ncbi:hypothetical protein AVEN_47709-1 [Araneus ventricosus]|uniref:DUF4371 domain-containing protein n=1 Tax=Araneus ventricosus TaxID=182803 RepID=A0A4Y2P0Y6_ARAVE|nr:hypothetical protein AVEN_69487-1 [Araneus ventricosus]GBN44662.1 hypothetical protein AVEN_211197-1 [Araneus ventricosus]GBN44679.1 hypothetical protein AVEN_98742-1 [Araneus ventricosus]GBN44690.1 hypothetical protein AVEN_47709-1 [Araneus ventricosus]